MAGASREQWGSEWGFLLAAVGSAVGLGNMWRFSYLTAEKGGAGFVGLYLFFTLLIGLPVMLAIGVISGGWMFLGSASATWASLSAMSCRER